MSMLNHIGSYSHAHTKFENLPMRKLIRSLYFILFGLVIYLLFNMFDNPKTVDIPLNEDREYLQPLQFKSVLSKDSGIYFTNHEQTNFNNIQTNRVFAARGFQFCKILDGATFDALVDIKDFGSSVAEKNPDWSEFINLIDSRAYDIYQALLRKFHRADQNEVKRLACYTAGEGQTVVANLTYNRLLQEIHPVNYFKDILPAIIPNRIGDESRKKYQLAYLLMAHDKNGYLALVKLLELLDDGNAIILIHIDARPNSDALFDSIEEFVSERKRSRPNSAIFMAKHRIANIWGHISLVFTQLSGFWELYDLADWEYVINISNYDYPLKKNSQIYKYLSQPQYKGQNFIEYWQDTCNSH